MPSGPPALLFDELPDSGQMMVVVFGNEIKMVHEPHGLFQPRMHHRARKQCGLNLFHAIHKAQPRPAKVAKNVR